MVVGTLFLRWNVYLSRCLKFHSANLILFFQIDPQQITLNASDMPGIYRQTTETTGMYSFKKPLYRDQQILPSKNCATQKVLPSQRFISPYDYPRKSNTDEPLEAFKNSYSLPHLKNVLNQDDSISEYEHFYQYYAQARRDNSRYEHRNHYRREPPLPPVDYQTRPYTPPEKRYNSYFGSSVTRETETLGRQRPKSGCVYDDVHISAADDYCVIKVNSDKNLSHLTNVRVREFPRLQFSQMYIQDRFDD